MRLFFYTFITNLGRRLEWVLRHYSDSLVARILLLAVRRGQREPLVYRGWVVSLVQANPGFLVLVVRRERGTLEDIGALLGALVRLSDAQDPAMPPFQVVSRNGGFIAWGWRPDGTRLSGAEQSAVLSAVLGRQEPARVENWKELN